MANVIKMNEVRLMTGFTAGAAECYACKQLLENNGIKFELLHYGDESAHPQIFEAMNSWSFGSNFEQKTFTDFPIITWKEFYDDYERWVNVATNSKELAESNLIKNASLVK